MLSSGEDCLIAGTLNPVPTNVNPLTVFLTALKIAFASILPSDPAAIVVDDLMTAVHES